MSKQDLDRIDLAERLLQVAIGRNDVHLSLSAVETGGGGTPGKPAYEDVALPLDVRMQAANVALHILNPKRSGRLTF